jgi:hypothetical protein
MKEKMIEYAFVASGRLTVVYYTKEQLEKLRLT